MDWWPLQPAHPRPSARRTPGRWRRCGQASISITGEYFETLRIPLRQGRTFTPRDRLGAEPVAIVSETLARRLWQGRPAVGRQVRVSGEPDGDAAPPDVSCTVIGVVGDVRQGASDEDLGDLYRPLLQEPGRFAFLQVRVLDASSGWEAAFRRTLAAVDPDLPMGSPRRLEEAVDEQRARPRFLASLLAAFAVPAGLLALMGVYGTIAYATRQREREVAVRMALGADGRAIVGLFVREGSRVLAGGLALGLAAALAMGRLLQSELFDVRAGDPGLLALTAGVLAVAGLTAVWWPARRAALTAPAEALRRE